MFYNAIRSHGLLLVAAGLVVGCSIGKGPGSDAEYYERRDLTADRDGIGEHTDPNLVNPWGLAYGPDSYFWVANEGSGTATVYDGDGADRSDVIGGPVRLPSVTGRSRPTGIVYNGSSGFEIASGSDSGPSHFLFATLDGVILGWSPDVDPKSGVIAVDNSSDSSYTGLAIGRSGGQTLLYAANFAKGRIDVFGEDFEEPRDLASRAFRDDDVPSGYVPFGIQNLDGRIYVAWAMPNSRGDDAMTGAGLGYVNVFEANGALIDTVALGNQLNAPWGMAMAPSDFGQHGGALLVGNFGDGRITAFDVDGYDVLGQLESEEDRPIVVPGLWGLMFGNGRQAGNADELYFTAGTDDETHGLFGSIRTRQ
jgi:uncharacterized protein (TIGR03118 family)